MNNRLVTVSPNGRSEYSDTKEGVLRSLRHQELAFSDLVRPVNAEDWFTIEEWLVMGSVAEPDPMRDSVNFRERMGWLSIIAVLFTVCAALFAFYTADQASWAKEKAKYRNRVAELEARAKEPIVENPSAGEVSPAIAIADLPSGPPSSSGVAASSSVYPSTFSRPLLPPLSPEHWSPQRYPLWAPSSVPFVAENGSYSGEPNSRLVPKSVYVNGYYRRDGTYVRGHYRAAPRR